MGSNFEIQMGADLYIFVYISYYLWWFYVIPFGNILLLVGGLGIPWVIGPFTFMFDLHAML